MANNLAAVEEQARRLGRPILGHLNHPNFGYAITAEELAMVTKERFFEVYNGHPDVHHLGDETHAGVERMWDIINTLRIGEMKAAPVSGLATDDSHNYFGTGGLVAGPGLGHGPGPVPDPRVDHQGDRGGGLLRLQRRDAEGGPLLRPSRRPWSWRSSRRGTPGTRPGSSGRSRATTRPGSPSTDKDGKPLPVTQRYSDDVGKVLATVEGTEGPRTG